MEIDGEGPQKGLELSLIANLKSMMNPDLTEHGIYRLELSEDELGAIRFLYPVCSGNGPN